MEEVEEVGEEERESRLAAREIMKERGIVNFLGVHRSYVENVV